MSTFEFDVVVTVRKRIHCSGPADRETARKLMSRTIMDGIGFGPFAKRDSLGHPIETILSNDLTLEDPRHD